MIVFTLGTIIYPFDRAVDWLELLLEKEIITEPILFQHGSTSVARLDHPLLTSVTSLSKTEMQESIKRASLVISHACLLYTSPSPRDLSTSRMPSSA